MRVHALSSDRHVCLVSGHLPPRGDEIPSCLLWRQDVIVSNQHVENVLPQAGRLIKNGERLRHGLHSGRLERPLEIPYGKSRIDRDAS